MIIPRQLLQHISPSLHEWITDRADDKILEGNDSVESIRVRLVYVNTSAEGFSLVEYTFQTRKRQEYFIGYVDAQGHPVKDSLTGEISRRIALR